tara:strand:+ start:6150 stop:6821 length:672 start_codon:yes stop_codon:yes gene_type:complete
MAGLITGIASLAIGAGSAIYNGIAASNAKKKQEKKEKAAATKLQQLERSRQAVIDQSGKIRALKDQVFNPYANLAVANKASDLKIEQTDQALANTLEQINQSGTGAGGATALARMAAASKAQVGASLENQEVANNKLRAEGEASANAQKMQLEQAAIGEETAAWGRQEGREQVQLDRTSGMMENAQAQAAAYGMQGTQAVMSGLASGASGFASGYGAYMAGQD